MDYRARVVDAELRRALAAVDPVVIEGPKACGKTVTARQVATSELRVDTDPRVPPAIAVDPALWSHVRRAVDDRQQAGQFILTGSATPDDDAARHSGACRFAPAVRRHIVGTWSRKVDDLAAYDPNCVAGDVCGGANSARQLVARPRLRGPYETGVPRVYLCSASTPPGAGVHGMCGFNAAQVALGLARER
jgi:phytoene dehydrogenase-like protein